VKQLVSVLETEREKGGDRQVLTVAGSVVGKLNQKEEIRRPIEVTTFGLLKCWKERSKGWMRTVMEEIHHKCPKQVLRKLWERR